MFSAYFYIRTIFVRLTDFELKNHETKKVRNFQFLITLKILNILQNNLTLYFSTPITTK